MAFVAGLLGDFDRYLARGDIDLLRDGMTYRLAGLWLDDSEYLELARELTRLLQPRLANLPAPGRNRWFLGTVVIPADESGPGNPGPERPGPEDPGPEGPGPEDPDPNGRNS